MTDSTRNSLIAIAVIACLLALLGFQAHAAYLKPIAPNGLSGQAETWDRYWIIADRGGNGRVYRIDSATGMAWVNETANGRVTWLPCYEQEPTK